jgi:hypothetical protein
LEANANFCADCTATSKRSDYLKWCVVLIRQHSIKLFFRQHTNLIELRHVSAQTRLYQGVEIVTLAALHKTALESLYRNRFRNIGVVRNSGEAQKFGSGSFRMEEVTLERRIH